MSNKVKKILSLVLVAILGVNLAACSNQKRKQPLQHLLLKQS